MATLRLENIPDDLFKALRSRACQHRRTIAAEVVSLIEENIPSERELKARQQFFRQAKRSQSRRTLSTGPFPSSEEMRSEDRLR